VAVFLLTGSEFKKDFFNSIDVFLSKGGGREVTAESFLNTKHKN
jgi:hypothetical protein